MLTQICGAANTLDFTSALNLSSKDSKGRLFICGDETTKDGFP